MNLNRRDILIFALGTLPFSISLGFLKQDSLAQILARCLGVMLISLCLLYGVVIAMRIWCARRTTSK